MRYSYDLTQPRTNNEAEYEALIAGLEIAASLKIQNLHIFGDSQLIINQVLGIYKISKLELAYYHKRALQLMKQIPNITMTRVPRAQNSKADSLAKLAKEMANMNFEPVSIDVYTRRVLEPADLQSPQEEGSLNENQQEIASVIPHSPRQVDSEGQLDDSQVHEQDPECQNEILSIEESDNWR